MRVSFRPASFSLTANICLQDVKPFCCCFCCCCCISAACSCVLHSFASALSRSLSHLFTRLFLRSFVFYSSICFAFCLFYLFLFVFYFILFYGCWCHCLFVISLFVHTWCWSVIVTRDHPLSIFQVLRCCIFQPNSNIPAIFFLFSVFPFRLAFLLPLQFCTFWLRSFMLSIYIWQQSHRFTISSTYFTCNAITC